MNAITVSVAYDDFLAITLPRGVEGVSANLPQRAGRSG